MPPKPSSSSKPLCIRCPAAEKTAAARSHGERLSKCLKEFAIGGDMLYGADELWPDFEDGENNIDFSDKDTCIELVKEARKNGSDAVFQGSKINKGMLEAAAPYFPDPDPAPKKNKTKAATPVSAFPVAPSGSVETPEPSNTPPVVPSVTTTQQAPANTVVGPSSTTTNSAAGPPVSRWANPPHLTSEVRPAVTAVTTTQGAAGQSSQPSALSPMIPAFVPPASDLAAHTSASPQPPTGQASSSKAGDSVPTLPKPAATSTQQVSGLDYTQKLALQIASQSGLSVAEVKNKFGLRTALALGGSPGEVFTNHLSLTPPAHIYVYSLEMIRDWTPPPTIDPIYVKKQWDRLQVVNVLKQRHWQTEVRWIDTNIWVTDGDLIWSAQPLFNNVPQNMSVIELLDPIPAITYHNEVGQQLTVRRVRVSWVHTIDCRNTSVGALFYDSNDDGLPGILARGLNTFLTRVPATHNGIGPNNATIVGNNRSFQNATRKALDDTVNAMKGFFLSVRPGTDNILVNFNHATSPFFESLLVSQFVTRCRNSRPPRSDAEIKQLLKGVKVQIVYNAPQYTRVPPVPALRNRYIKSVGDSISRQAPNPQDYPHDPTLVAWYNGTQHSADPKFPSDAPYAYSQHSDVWAINTSDKDHHVFPDDVEWFPADRLRIVPGTPFRGHLTGRQTSEMMKSALRHAHVHQHDLRAPLQSDQTARGGLVHFGFTGTPNLLQQTGMSVSTNLERVDARWLQPPDVQYRDPEDGSNKNANIRNAAWNLQNVKFRQTPTQLPELLILVLRDSRNTNVSLPNNFETVLKTQLHMHGMIANVNIATDRRTCNLQTARPLSLAWEEAFEKGLRDFPRVKTLLADSAGKGAGQKGNLSWPVLVVMQHHSYDEYASIKRIGDLKLGVNTICMVKDKLGYSLQPQKASNIALKYNVKAEGKTHFLKNVHVDTLQANGSTIILGADVAHPSKGCAIGTPSVSAVVGTFEGDNFMSYQGSMRLQRGSKEEIGQLQNMVYERVLAWADCNNNRLPTNILFYRDGVSESQYEMVRSREIPQIQNAMNEAARRLDPASNAPSAIAPPTIPPPNAQSTKTKPQQEAEIWKRWATQIEAQPTNFKFDMTFVVVGKRHNTRFYPVDRKDNLSNEPGKVNSNVKPGLAVDRVVTHPTSMDFYLQSHEPIKGTGRSAHYFVVQNNMALSIEQLQEITHTFCYAYARATRGVSYCAPAYYADKLCDRGRAYIRSFLVNSNELNGINGHFIDRLMDRNGNTTFHGNPSGSINRPTAINRPQRNPAETPLQYMDRIAHHIATNGHYFRMWRDPNASTDPNVAGMQLNGAPRMNPWHRNLDSTMFWL